MNSKFIGSQQTHRKKFTSNRSPRDHCIENQKREGKPSSYCLWTHRSMVNYSRIIGEAPMRMMNPSVMVLDWILRFWNLRRPDVFFIDSSRVLEYLGIYRAQRWWRRFPRRPQPTRARPGPLARPGVLWAAWPPSWLLLWPTGFLLVQKNLQKVSSPLDPFGIDFMRSKKQAKTATGTLALCQ